MTAFHCANSAATCTAPCWIGEDVCEAEYTAEDAYCDKAERAGDTERDGER